MVLMPVCCVLVDASGAEVMRRALDRAGLLDVRRRVSRMPEGRVALPLKSSAEEARRVWEGVPLSLVELA